MGQLGAWDARDQLMRNRPGEAVPAPDPGGLSQKLMPAFGKRSEIGMKAEPIMPKACSIPCICKTFTKASSVVIFMAHSPTSHRNVPLMAVATSRPSMQE